MTTKLFEALAVGKPILCVRNDESVLEKTLKETNAGLAASSIEQVELFLQEHFAIWEKQGYTEVSILPEV